MLLGHGEKLGDYSHLGSGHTGLHLSPLVIGLVTFSPITLGDRSGDRGSPGP